MTVSRTFRFFNNKKPVYIKDVFRQAGHPNVNSKPSFLKLNQPLGNSNHGQKRLSYIAFNIWKSLLNALKPKKVLNTYKLKIKNHFLDRMRKSGK